MSRRYRAIGVLTAALSLICALTGLGAQAAPATSVTPAHAAAACPKAQQIDVTLKAGTRWQMCWTNDRTTGPVISDVVYTPNMGRPTEVIASASLAEVHVPYDSGDPRYYDVSQIGFGDLSLGTLIPVNKVNCPGGQLHAYQGTDILCTRIEPREIAYENGAQHSELEGTDLVVYSISEIGWYDYVVEYRFSDDGMITPRAGATGSLSPFQFTDPSSGWPTGIGSSRFSEDHDHNVFWRIDFDVDGHTANTVEQYDFTGSGTATRTTKKTTITHEAALDYAAMRWWRVVDPTDLNSDGHAASWQIDSPMSDSYRGPSPTEDFTHHDLYITQYKACEKLADNQTTAGCATSVDKYVNGQKLTDPVFWVSVDFHHVPRDEDQDPMPTHWQGFSIMPRDVTATSQLP
jgi:primary-amine oxidase